MTAAVDAIQDGSHDFDFLFGRWTVTNRKLRNSPQPDGTNWDEFEAYVETEPVLAGLGNLDRYHAPQFPGRPRFQALALRLYDPESRTWRIWWASTAAGGRLDTPVVGGFTGDRGVCHLDAKLGHELASRLIPLP